MKKIILLVVEGKSERIALEGIFQKLLGNKDENIRFELAYNKGGDVLQSTTALKDIIITVKNHLNEKKLISSDLNEIILISDLDGCYISNDNIMENAGSKITYCASKITCADKKNIEIRNQNKRTSLEELQVTETITIDGISTKFRIFFMACNLDHVLHNEINLNDRNKTRYANGFALEYIDREHDFIPFIEQFKFDMSESMIWSFIKRDLNSLSRCSNLYFLFRDKKNGNK